MRTPKNCPGYALSYRPEVCIGGCDRRCTLECPCGCHVAPGPRSAPRCALCGAIGAHQVPTSGPGRLPRAGGLAAAFALILAVGCGGASELGGELGGEDPAAAGTCAAGDDVRVLVWLRVFEEGMPQATCDQDLAVYVDGRPATRIQCVQAEIHDYHGIYEVHVAADFKLHAIDVEATDGRRISIGQEFLVSGDECSVGEAWEWTTVEVL